jgi:hypothetical protein
MAAPAVRYPTVIQTAATATTGNADEGHELADLSGGSMPVRELRLYGLCQNSRNRLDDALNEIERAEQDH